MKQFISFVIKEGKHILRDKRTMLILFGMPLVLMLIFGFAITTDVKNVRTVVVASSMASEIAVPSVPGCIGSLVMISFPARVDIDGEPSTVAPKVRMIELR